MLYYSMPQTGGVAEDGNVTKKGEVPTRSLCITRQTMCEHEAEDKESKQCHLRRLQRALAHELDD